MVGDEEVSALTLPDRHGTRVAGGKNQCQMNVSEVVGFSRALSGEVVYTKYGTSLKLRGTIDALVRHESHVRWGSVGDSGMTMVRAKCPLL